MHELSEVIWSDDLGMVRARGADARSFLQGQLSNDLMRLSAETALLAGYHNPQGRVIALLRLIYWDEGDVLAVLPRELCAGVASRLSKFVLRAKVKITDESTAWRMGGLIGATKVSVGAGAATQLPAAMNAQLRAGGAVFVRVGTDRVLVVSPVLTATVGVSSADVAAVGGREPVGSAGASAGSAAAVASAAGSAVTRFGSAATVGSTGGSAATAGDSVVGSNEAWRRLEIADGQPQVYAATSEEFVAQMLNLDMLNAIAFDKGCYTGQEVIARAHYRGRVKRRMQRFVSREPVRLAPGDAGQLADGRAFKVVLAAQLADGRCDFLAVAPLPDAHEEGTTAVAPPVAAAGISATAVNQAATASPTDTALLSADPAPLPYVLPD